MPAIRAKSTATKPVGITTSKRRGNDHTSARTQREGTVSAPVDDPFSVDYPLDVPARATFRTRDGKKVTEHQWAVYDLARNIPRGRVTTYGDLCKALGKGSPRSVGSALRRNPFAPFVPCHRVIASNLYIGGFFGEWGTSAGEEGMSGQRCRRRIEMLATEGVKFTVDGYLTDKKLIWKG